MASIIKRDGRWRALVRKAGHTRCATFATRALANEWARKVETQIDQLKAAGVMQSEGETLATLITRYTEEFYPLKRWGRSKSNDLARLAKDLGGRRADKLDSALLTTYFRKRQQDGAGPVVISAQLGYLIGVLEVARTVWHLDVPLQAAQDVRTAFSRQGLVGKSKRRDRRVTDTEIELLADQIEAMKETDISIRDVLQFCVASAMRISEVCRLEWRDLNDRDRTIVVRDRKHPTDKIGNDQTVPLLAAAGFDAYAIVKRQPRKSPRIFPYNSKTIGTYVTRAVAKLQFDDLHLHDLRHEGLSRLFEAGYRIEQVALVSGHRDWAMLKRYTHVRAKDLHRTPAVQP